MTSRNRHKSLLSIFSLSSLHFSSTLLCTLGLIWVAVESAPQYSNELKQTLVADHSRKTFRPSHEGTVQDILGDMNHMHSFASGSSRISREDVVQPLKSFAETFAESARERHENDQDPNIFKKMWYDPSYKVHNLCEEHNSGGQVDRLIWTESGDRILKIIGNGVVKDGYNMFIAPEQPNGRVTNVYVAIYIESMSSFKAQTMDFEMDMYLALGWYDRRLAHNCTYPILINSKVIADRMWSPDLYFVNSKFAYLQEVTTPNFMVIVYPDGMVFRSMRLDVTLSCSLNLHLFPMDVQECPIVIQSFAYIEQLVNLTWHIDPPNFPIGSNSEIKLNDMMITKQRYEKCSGPYPMFRGAADWSCIRAMIVMKRLVLFHIIQTYIPTAMLVTISWMSFWLDPRASPARISLTITSLLTLTTMSNGARQDLPQVSYIKALDIWLTFSQGLIFLVLLEYSFVSYFMTKRVFDCVHRRAFSHQKMQNNNGAAHKIVMDDEMRYMTTDDAEIPFVRRESASPPPPPPPVGQKTGYSLTQGLSTCMNNTAALMSATPHAAAHIYNKHDFSKPCQKCASNNEQRARKIDEYSRVMFPTAFFVFCSWYWWYYNWYQNHEEE